AAGLMSWAQNYWLAPGLFNNGIWLMVDVVWGIGFFIVLNRAVGAERRWRRDRRVPRSVALFASIGLFSYSLYLTHEIVEWRVWPLVARWLAASGHLLPQVVVMALLAIASLAFARGFFTLFERPFLSARRGISAPHLARATHGL